jgi:ferric-dicitrate binding protein FerR (iron transport regulator)
MNAQDSGDDRRTSEGEEIARLLRLAGPRPPVPGDTVGRVRSIVHAHWRAAVKADRRRRNVLWLAVSLATAAALVVAVGLARWRSPDRTAGTETPVATLTRTEGPVHLGNGRLLGAGEGLPAGAEVETGAGGRAALVLQEGVAVRLDAGSRLRLISTSVIGLTRGAVYLDSGGKSESAGSVQVRTDMGWVEDVGTQLEVRLLDGALQVSVRRGSAALHREGRSHLARAGVRLVAGAGDSVERQAVALQGPEWDWVLAIAPPFELEGRTLGEFLDWVSRETGREIKFADPAIAAEAPAIILHGTVEGLSPADAPAAVLPTCGLRLRVKGDTLMIERAAGGEK